MTIAMLLKAALVTYGLLLGGAFVFIRFYPALANRTVFEWSREAASIAGTLVPTDGVERAWLANAPVELLAPGFGDCLARIAGEARREIEEMARAAAEQAREEALAAAQAELAAADRQLVEADEALVAAAAALAPAAPPPADPVSPPVTPDPQRDPAILSAAARLESARAAEGDAREALRARVESFLADRRREQARLQLRVSSRRLAEAEGGGMQISVENVGPMAVTRMVLALASAGQPVAAVGGRAVLAPERTPLSFAPEIANEYSEKIMGLPPGFEWRMVLPLDGALEGRPEAFAAEVLDAEFADSGTLERASPYGAGVRIWSYPQSTPADLFAGDLRTASPQFPEALAVTQAERQAATAEADLQQARAQAEARARPGRVAAESAAQEPSLDPHRHGKADAAATRLLQAQAARDRLAAERDEIEARIGRIRAGTETALLSDRINDWRWEDALGRIKRSMAAKILEARLDERRDTARTDESGGFRFTGLPAGTYFVYSPLADPAGATLHYLQRLQFRQDGKIVFEPPVTMSQEQFLYGALEAGV